MFAHPVGNQRGATLGDDSHSLGCRSFQKPEPFSRVQRFSRKKDHGKEWEGYPSSHWGQLPLDNKRCTMAAVLTDFECPLQTGLRAHGHPAFSKIPRQPSPKPPNGLAFSEEHGTQMPTLREISQSNLLSSFQGWHGNLLLQPIQSVGPITPHHGNSGEGLLGPKLAFLLLVLF